MDINSIATEFIEVNQRRRELEKREEHLKGILTEHFQSTKTLSLDTDKGRICYQASQRNVYDIPMLREILPDSVFQFITRVSVNDVLLSQLIKDGKVSDVKVAPARQVDSVYRIVVQPLPDRSQIDSVAKPSSVEPCSEPPSKKKAKRTDESKKKTKDTAESKPGKAQKRKPV